MTIIERVKALGLPLDEIVVIGSGLLDALHLRESNDIDLVVSEALFIKLQSTSGYTLSYLHGEQRLEKGDVEIWRTWGAREDETYEMLQSEGVEVDGVRFCSPQIIIRHKQERQTPKDVRDTRLLREYLRDHPDTFR